MGKVTNTQEEKEEEFYLGKIIQIRYGKEKTDKDYREEIRILWRKVDHFFKVQYTKL